MELNTDLSFLAKEPNLERCSKLTSLLSLGCRSLSFESPHTSFFKHKKTKFMSIYINIYSNC